MSYIKLKSSFKKLQSNENYLDTFIISSIVQSHCSSVEPSLIRSGLDLELNFGNSFKYFEYYKELINMGATLYLYKPLSGNIVPNSENYIDLDNMDTFEGIFSSIDELPKNGVIDDGKYIYSVKLRSGLKYYIFDDSLNKYIEYLGEVPESLLFRGYYRTVDCLPEKGVVGGKSCKFHIGGEDLYVYSSDYEGFVDINELPQSISSTDLYLDFYNRDSLRLLDNSSTSYPRYYTDYYIPEYSEIRTWWNTKSEGSRSDYLAQLNNYTSDTLVDIDTAPSLALTLDWSQVPLQLEEDWYIVFPLLNSSYNSLFIYYSENEGDVPPLGSDILGNSHNIHITKDDVKNRTELFEIIKSCLEFGSKYGGKTGIPLESLYTCKYLDTTKLVFWNNSGVIRDTKFYNIPGLITEKNIPYTSDLLTVLSEVYDTRAEFFSRTMGPGDEPIKLEIEKLIGDKPEQYRITVSRYGYVEVFEGSPYLTTDDDGTVINFERIINQTSKLITCKFSPGVKKEEDDETNEKDTKILGLPTGTWILTRSETLNLDSKSYLRSLKKLSETGEILEDLLLIDNIENWIDIGVTKDNEYYKEYDYLLEYAKKKNCQILIENSGSNGDTSYLGKGLEDYTEGETLIPDVIYRYYEENSIKYLKHTLIKDINLTSRSVEIEQVFSDTYRGNWIFNKKNDLDNRLIYFYDHMKIENIDRPGYYSFVRSLLTGSFFPSTLRIGYLSPETDTRMKIKDKEGKVIDYVDLLQKYKSNFLTFNNFNYYYKELFSHSGDWKYNTTILSRILLSYVTHRVSREFKPFLSAQYNSDKLNGISDILLDIKNEKIGNFIHDLSLDYIEQDEIAQTLTIYLNLYLREILDKDVFLTIILNFNQS